MKSIAFRSSHHSTYPIENPQPPNAININGVPDDAAGISILFTINVKVRIHDVHKIILIFRRFVDIKPFDTRVIASVRFKIF